MTVYWQVSNYSLLVMPNKVVLKGLASTVLRATLLGKAAAADTLPFSGIFDRWNSEAHTAACLQAMSLPAFLSEEEGL
jgi:hypothetical protein